MSLINEIRPTMNENDNSFTLLVIKDLGFKGKKIREKFYGRKPWENMEDLWEKTKDILYVFFYCF